MERIPNLLPVGPDDRLTRRGARRHATRYPLNADVRVIGPSRADGVALNASAGGMRVTLDHGFDEGQELDLEVCFVPERSSRERARVVWSRALPDGWLVGLRFVAA